MAAYTSQANIGQDCTKSPTKTISILHQSRVFPLEFSNKFITAASETVLRIIGRGHEDIAVDLVRELDKIAKPHLRLQDVWRVKCLFDLVPQARTFIERIREAMPERIISMRDKF